MSARTAATRSRLLQPFVHCVRAALQQVARRAPMTWMGRIAQVLGGPAAARAAGCGRALCVAGPGPRSSVGWCGPARGGGCAAGVGVERKVRGVCWLPCLCHCARKHACTHACMHLTHTRIQLSIGRFDWPSGWIRKEREWERMDSETQLLWRVLGCTGPARFCPPGPAPHVCILHAGAPRPTRTCTRAVRAGC